QEAGAAVRLSPVDAAARRLATDGRVAAPGGPPPPMSVSVIIAAYNEAPVIGEVVRRTLAALPGAEVIVADDGSTDGTDAIASNSGAVVVHLHQNRGKGHAVRRGLARARGELLVLLDGDGQDDPADIPALLAALSNADLVV